MILDEETKKKVLEHYPEQYHRLLKIQILVIEDMMAKNLKRYQYSTDFRAAVDLMLADVLNGKYLGRDMNEH
jgi:hypothetical protein